MDDYMKTSPKTNKCFFIRKKLSENEAQMVKKLRKL